MGSNWNRIDTQVHSGLSEHTLVGNQTSVEPSCYDHIICVHELEGSFDLQSEQVLFQRESTSGRVTHQARQH